jgi:hypothetical protein
MLSRKKKKKNQKVFFAASSRLDMCHHTQPGAPLGFSPPTIVFEMMIVGAAGAFRCCCAVLVAIVNCGD